MIYKNSLLVQSPRFWGIRNWTLSNLNHLTVLFGKNGSGKSILLRAIRDLDSETTHYVIPERTGNITFEPSFMAEEIEASRRKDASSSNFVNGYRSRVISRIQSYFNTRGATRSRQLPGNPDDLEELLKYLLSDFEITLRAGNPPYRLIRLSDGAEITDVSVLSSGESQLLSLSIDILTIAAIWDIQKKDKRILLIDEPDTHLHPDLQIRFADFISQVVKKFDLQVIIATHSTTLLSALGQFCHNDCSTIFLNRTINEFKAQPFNKYLKELSSCLGGHLLMGPLFGAPLMLVEGDDDYRVWSQIPRHGFLNLAVLPTNGDEIKHYQKTLERLFSSISEVHIVGLALIDGDKELTQASASNPQNYIPFIRLGCRECENLYLTDEVLADLGLNWEEARIRIKAESHKYGNKSEQLNQVPEQDRRTCDLKGIMNELSQILDSKNVHWTTRVGNVLGKETPKGQLMEFLGPSLLKAIWGNI
jgi:predicted ATPase